MQAQRGEGCLSQRKSYEWIESFKQGSTSLFDDKRSDSPSCQILRSVLVEVPGVIPFASKIRIVALISSILQIDNGAAMLNGLLHSSDCEEDE
ncbi:hypothetical protein TNCV_127531 [Trichonephila clavipes]|nr:hypothetical protein TNCV_127531 [Trichonephila clavipes]